MWLLAFERPTTLSYHCCTTTCCLVIFRTRSVWLLVSKPVTSCSECMYLLCVLCLFFVGKLFKIRIDRQMVIRTTTYLKRRRCGNFPNCERRKTFVLDNTHVDQYNSYTCRDKIQWHPQWIYISSRTLMTSPRLSRQKNRPGIWSTWPYRGGTRGVLSASHVARVIRDIARRNSKDVASL